MKSNDDFTNLAFEYRKFLTFSSNCSMVRWLLAWKLNDSFDNFVKSYCAVFFKSDYKSLDKYSIAWSPSGRLWFLLTRGSHFHPKGRSFAPWDENDSHGLAKTIASRLAITQYYIYPVICNRFWKTQHSMISRNYQKNHWVFRLTINVPWSNWKKR